MTPQCTRLLMWLENVGPIHNLQAWRKLGIYRLGARIYELKNDYNYDIRDRRITVRNRFGEVCHVKQFYLNQGEQK